jgi:short-subunit dehydrogenase
MKEQRSGHIITLGSLGSIVPMPFESLYCSSKFGVRGFCLSLREELRGTGIEVSLISPGPVETPMLQRESNSHRSTMAFVQKPLDPGVVAKAILRVMRKSSPERVLPVQTTFAAFLMGAFPALFTAAYPLLNLIGGFRLKSYRRNLTAPVAASLEPVYE